MFRRITKQDSPDAGDFKVGETVKLGYGDQSRDSLNADKTIWEEISDGLDLVMLGTRQVNSRAYVARFNFSGGDQQKKVGGLSGGDWGGGGRAVCTGSAAGVTGAGTSAVVGSRGSEDILLMAPKMAG